MVDLTELFVHWEAGRSQAQIAESLGLDRKTVRKYLAPAWPRGWCRAARRRVRRCGRSGSRSGSRSCPSPGAAGDLAGDRGAPGLHRRAARWTV